MEQVIKDIQEEIARQNAKWGDQSHPGFKWCAILMEEVGEACQAILEKDINHAREEFVQVSAVAAQIVAAIDREMGR